jgi:hypothetical protein
MTRGSQVLRDSVCASGKTGVCSVRLPSAAVSLLSLCVVAYGSEAVRRALSERSVIAQQNMAGPVPKMKVATEGSSSKLSLPQQYARVSQCPVCVYVSGFIFKCASDDWFCLHLVVRIVSLCSPSPLVGANLWVRVHAAVGRFAYRRCDAVQYGE